MKFFDKLVDSVSKGMSPKNYEKPVAALKEESPSEYFARIGKENEAKAIKNKEKEDSLERGKAVEKQIKETKKPVTTPVSVASKSVEKAKPVTETKTEEKPKKSVFAETSAREKEVAEGEKKKRSENMSKATESYIDENRKRMADLGMDLSQSEKAYKKMSENAKKDATDVADENTKKQTKRLLENVGGGLLGVLGDNIGLYGDAMANAKHNLAQAYFQAAGKGANYTDSQISKLRGKRFDEMINGLRDIVKRNNESESGLINNTIGKQYNDMATMYGDEFAKRWGAMNDSLIRSGKQTYDDYANMNLFLKENKEWVNDTPGAKEWLLSHHAENPSELATYNALIGSMNGDKAQIDNFMNNVMEMSNLEKREKQLSVSEQEKLFNDRVELFKKEVEHAKLNNDAQQIQNVINKWESEFRMKYGKSDKYFERAGAVINWANQTAGTILGAVKK